MLETFNIHEEKSHKDFPLPEALANYVTAAQIRDNRYNYPEWFESLDVVEIEQIRAISERLMELPLVHCSRNPELDKISPYCDINKQVDRHNSYPLDNSLGLDQYVFLSWGLGDWALYGQEYYCFSPRLLFQPGTIVTPSDVADAANWDMESTFEELHPKVQKQVNDEYFSKMLTGPDWMHVVAIRILRRLQAGEKVVGINAKTFGEIKVFGEINEFPLAFFSGRTEIQTDYYNRFLYPIGFAYENIVDARLKKLPPGGVDPQPDPALWEQAQRAWDDVMHSRNI